MASTTLAILLLGERPAHAYLDPGSGSLVYQAVIAVLLGFGFTCRRVVASVVRAVRARSGNRGVTSDRPTPDR